MKHQGAYILLISFGMLGAAYAGCNGGGDTGSGGAGGAGGTGNSNSSTGSKSSSKASSVTSSSTGMAAGAIGKACAADADCGAGFTCIKDSDTAPAFGGGPAGGYCSKTCATDADCPGAGASLTVCATDAQGMNGLCLLGCTFGPQLMAYDDPLDPSKCYGRDDVRCQSLNMASIPNACIPTCGKDSQCPAGRVCDPRLAVCVNMANKGKPTGAKCNQNANPPECAGVCVSFAPMMAITACSNRCVLGGQPIANSPNCGGIDKGLCAFSVQGAGAGDFGFCSPACTAHDQCQNPSFWCADVGAPNGYCFGVNKCPGGQADCTQGGMCTMTPSGPFCLDTKYPLNSMDGGAPDGGSSSSSSSSASSTSSSSGGGASSSSSSSSGMGGAGGAPVDAGAG